MLNIAIAGLGTVGSGVMRLLQQNRDLITSRAGQPITIKAISARNKKKRRDCDTIGAEWVDDPRKLVEVPGIDVVVELIGAADGMAYELAEAVLKSGKSLVTANKALLAAHGAHLAKLAESIKAQLSFEAAVAGGIPVIKALREGMAGNSVSVVRGILNGTCNYILTRMREEKLSFDMALREAQEHGYAEADPAADIDGHDTANKLALLAALAFGCEPDMKAIQVEGIRRITPVDLQFADDLGCRIKLLGVAQMSEAGLEQRVGPSLVSTQSPLAQVDGILNAVLMRGHFVGDLTLQGQGAGGEPTASAVVADIIDIARGHRSFPFGIPAAQLKKPGAAHYGASSRYYMRLQVTDKPGVVADISAILRDEAISIESLLQRGRSDTQSVPVVITTHAAKRDAMHHAMEKIAKVPAVVERPCLIPIED